MSVMEGGKGQAWIGGEWVNGEIVGGTKIADIDSWAMSTVEPFLADISMTANFKDNADFRAANDAIRNQKDFTIKVIDGQLSFMMIAAEKPVEPENQPIEYSGSFTANASRRELRRFRRKLKRMFKKEDKE